VDTSAQDPTRAPRARISGIVYRVAYSELVAARLAFMSWSASHLRTPRPVRRGWIPGGDDRSTSRLPPTTTRQVVATKSGPAGTVAATP